MAEAQQTAPPKSAKTVTVACKMPGGLRLQLQQEFEETEMTQQGPKTVKRHRKIDEGIVVAGCAVDMGPGAPRKNLVGGYALTRNVDADFWARWLEQNKDAPYVKNGIIFAMPSRDAAEDKATEQAEVRSGLEPLNPAHRIGPDGLVIPDDPRFPRAIGGVSAVHTGERSP